MEWLVEIAWKTLREDAAFLGRAEASRLGSKRGRRRHQRAVA